MKKSSQVKHAILARYLAPYLTIVGKYNRDICLIDANAGTGRYTGPDGALVDGSAITIVRKASAYCTSHPDRRVRVILMEKDRATATQLDENLADLRPFLSNLDVNIRIGDCEKELDQVLRQLPARQPLFVNIDPYGFPPPLSLINRILMRPKAEVFINLMWCIITQRLDNPQAEDTVSHALDSTGWQHRPFKHQVGWKREKSFLEDYCSWLHAEFTLHYRVMMDATEDRLTGTKYYLVHASNHHSARDLMTSVMWPLGDGPGSFQYSASQQQALIPYAPDSSAIGDLLLKEFMDRILTFADMQKESWRLRLTDKQYRDAIKYLVATNGQRLSGWVEVIHVRPTSRADAIRSDDLIAFSPF